MEFDLSKPQKLLRETAHATLAQTCPLSRVREMMASETTHDKSLWQTIADQGWIGLHLDENVGGLGLGLVELTVIAEEMGRACLPGPYLATTWAATLLAQLANSQSIALLQSITLGEHTATVALLDQDSDWDIEQVQLQLRSTQSGWQLTGRKTLVLDAEASDTILCVVRQGSELAIVLVSARGSGLSLKKTRSLDATRTLYDVEFDGVSIAEHDIVAVGSQAREALEHSMRVATLAACAEMLGAMQWIRETTLDYAKTRKQFDRTIGSYQAVQHQCADMLLMTESARAATYYAAWALSASAPDADKAVAIAKAYCSDVGREVAHRGVQVHGGIGFTWEHDIHLFFKRIKVCEFLFGDATWQREQIAKLILA
ncbi:MAG: acyl-CoA dehydrogenase family protein [Pirellulaceae bacterium]|nr:acyl-CoA dehydrogenase family protein [Pirellulaceae bacterium]